MPTTTQTSQPSPRVIRAISRIQQNAAVPNIILQDARFNIDPNGSDAFSKLIEGLKTNTNLLHLNLLNCSFTKSYIGVAQLKQLAAAMQENKTLLTLSYDQYLDAPKGQTALYDTINGAIAANRQNVGYDEYSDSEDYDPTASSPSFSSSTT